MYVKYITPDSFACQCFWMFLCEGVSNFICDPSFLKNLLIEIVFLAALKQLNQTKQDQGVGKPFIQIADNREVVRD